MTALDEAVATFSRWLHYPEERAARELILVTAGTYVANRLPGDPLWLLVVGASSSGKTETIGALSGLPDLYPTATLTEAALLSGVRSKEHAAGAKGGLLMEVGDFGIVSMKDFTSILSMRRDQRPEVLAALREVYDGEWTRRVGTDGGKALTWRGKCGLIAGCTPIIDSHHQVVAVMGERFVMFRMPAADGDAQARRVLENTGREAEMRMELCGVMHELVESANLAHPPRDPVAEELILAGATLAARARSPVERDGYTREVELIPGAEGPGRLTRALSQLYAGVVATGGSTTDAQRIVAKVALDCIPEPRRTVLARLAECEAPQRTDNVARLAGYPPSSTKRALEELAAYGVVTRTVAEKGNKADEWIVSTWARERFDAVANPKCTEPFINPNSEGRTFRVYELAEEHA